VAVWKEINLANSCKLGVKYLVLQDDDYYLNIWKPFKFPKISEAICYYGTVKHEIWNLEFEC
jgi:hypothetical protein